MPDAHEFTVRAGEAGLRLDQHPGAVDLAGSRSRLQAWIRAERVEVEGVVRPGRHRLVEGARLRIHPPDPEPSGLEPEPIPLDIAYADEDVVVVRKPPGLVVHPGAGHRSGTLVNALLYHVPELRGMAAGERPGIVHRLDRDTSGLMVVARHDRALRTLQAGFQDRSIRRRYWAVALGAGLDDRCTFDTAYGRHPRDRRRFTGRAGRRRAVTHTEVLWRGRVAALLVAELKTGRTHQIRVHLSEAGHPVVGDLVYGRPVRDHGSSPAGARGTSAGSRGTSTDPAREARLLRSAGRMLLHAAELRFPHPRDGRPMRFLAPPKAEMAEVLDAWMGPEAHLAVWQAFSEEGAAAPRCR